MYVLSVWCQSGREKAVPIQLQIPVLVAVPGPAITCDDDDNDDKPDHLAVLVVFGGCIVHTFEAIVECLPVLVMENDNDDNDDDDEEEVEEIEEEEL